MFSYGKNDTILILGIIALIAIPTVTKIIETAKKNSLKLSVIGILEAGNYYYATNEKNIEDIIIKEKIKVEKNI